MKGELEEATAVAEAFCTDNIVTCTPLLKPVPYAPSVAFVG